MKGFWKKFWFWCCLLGWVIFHSIGGVFSGIVCSACVAVLCIKWVKRAQEKTDGWSGDFESYPLATLSPNEITEVLLHAELAKYKHEGRTIARKTLIRRSIGTPIFVVAHFLILYFFYDKAMCTIWGTLLAVLYTYFFICTGTMRILRQQAQAHPNKAFSKIVEEELGTAEQSSGIKTKAIAGIAMLVASVVVFFCLCSAPQWRFSQGDQGYTITSYRASVWGGEHLEIPGEHQGQPVVAIGERAFAGIQHLQTVTVPKTVRSIDKQAFKGCRWIQEIQLPEGLENIGSGAFANCKEMESITLPQSLIYLQGESFQNCKSLTNITIPGKVTEIRGNTFEGCDALTEVNLHNGIVDIHASAFKNCVALENILLPENITQIHADTFYGCKSLKKIHIPEGVIRIAAHSFQGCSDLEEVYVPDSVEEIRSSAFRECGSLKSITVPAGVVINERAFKDSPTEVIRRESEHE